MRKILFVLGLLILSGVAYISYVTYLPQFIWAAVYADKYKEANNISSQLKGTQVLLKKIQCFDIFYRCGIHQIVTTDISADSFEKYFKDLGWDELKKEDGKVIYTTLGLDTGLKVSINGVEDAFVYNRDKLENPKRIEVIKNQDRVNFYERTKDNVTLNGRELKENIVEIWLQIRPKQ